MIAPLLRWAVALALLAMVFGNTGAQAAEGKDRKYAIDWALDYCKAKTRGNTVMAVNDLGTYWCAWDWPSMAEARSEALRQCQAQPPATMRKSLPCKVMYENGKIVDPARYKAMRMDLRMPVMIESYNGATKKTENLKGYMVFGGAPDELTRTASIHLADGTAICVGAARLRRLKLQFSFTATCFGDQIFKGEAKVTGLVKIDGLQRLALDLLIRNDPSFARITTR